LGRLKYLIANISVWAGALQFDDRSFQENVINKGC